MRNTALFILAILLILSLVGNYLQWNSGDEIAAVDSVRIEKLARADAKDARADSTLALSRAIWKKDSLDMVARSESFKTQANKRQTEIDRLKALRASEGIVPDQTTQNLEKQFELSLSEKNKEIETLTADKGIMSKRYEVDMAAMVQKLEAANDKTEVWRVSAEKAEKEVTKQRKALKWLKGGLAVAVGYIIIDRVSE